MPNRMLATGVVFAGVLAIAVLLPRAVAAEEVARIKVVKGTVSVDREGSPVPATVGMALQEGDVVKTGKDGAVGITFKDDSLLSAGPGSTLAIDRFKFNPTTHAGSFDTTLRSGTLAVASGKIARQSPDAMRVRTPSTVLGVRGTEFVVRAAAVTP